MKYFSYAAFGNLCLFIFFHVTKLMTRVSYNKREEVSISIQGGVQVNYFHIKFINGNGNKGAVHPVLPAHIVTKYSQ